MNNIQKNFKMKSRLRGLADGGPNMLQRGVDAVGDYVGRIGPAWSESNAQFETTNPSFGQRVDRALMPHTGFGSALGSVHDAMGRGNLREAAGEAVGTIPGFSALRAAKTGMGAAKAVGKQVGKQAGTEAYKQAGGMSVMPTTTPQPNPEARGQTMAEYLKMSGRDWLELVDKGLMAGAPAFVGNAPQRWRDGYDARQTAAKKRESGSALRGLADGGGMFTPEERARFAEQHAMQADADQAGFAQAAELAAAAPQAQQVAMPQDMVPSGGAPVPTFDDLEPPEYELQDGGTVVGKGGPTDDLVGPVALSNEEYVLPADTVEIVGRDNLDKLRLETHDFEDPEAKIAATGGLPQPVKGSALRGLADGASPNWRRLGSPTIGGQANFIEGVKATAPQMKDGVMNTGPRYGANQAGASYTSPAQPKPLAGASYTAPPAQPAVKPAATGWGPQQSKWSATQSSPLRTAGAGTSYTVPPQAAGAGAPPPPPPGAGAPPPPPPGAGAPPPSNSAAARNAVKNAFSKAGSATRTGAAKAPGLLAKLGVLVGNATGVSKSIDDVESGYRDQFNESIGATKGLSAVPGDIYRAASRFVESLVDPMDTDWMNRVNRGIDSTLAGDGFGKGWDAPTHAPREPIFQSKYSGDLLRQLSNIGNVQSFGQADKLGNYLATGEYAPSEGSREVFLENKANESVPEGTDVAADGLAPNLAPVEAGSYESKRLEQMGVAPEAQNTGVVPDAQRNSVLRNTEGNIPGQMTNFGTLGGNGNIYGTATEEGGRINSFSGVGRGTRQAPQPGDPNFMGYGGGGPQTGGSLSGGMSGVTEWGKGTPAMSGSALRNPNQRDFVAEQKRDKVNERYDRLAKQLKGTYGPKGQGNLAKRMLQLEQDRSAALQGMDNSDNSRYDTDSRSESSRYTADSSLRGSQMSAAATLANAQARSAQTAQTAAMREAAKADKDEAARNKAGYDRYTSAISNMFMTPDGEDKQAQEDFTAFVQRTDPRALTSLSGMAPDDMSAVLQELRLAYEMGKAQDASGQRGVFNNTPVSNKYDPIREVRESAWSDVFGADSSLSLKDYFMTNMPLTNRNVGVGESGRVARMSDLATNDKGEWDSGKLAIIAGSSGKQLDANGDPIKKSSLRSN